MNAKATFMAKLPSRRKTAASAFGRRFSCRASSFRAPRRSIGVVIHSAGVPAQLAADHDFLQGLGRSLVENNAHLDVIDVVELAQTAAEAGLARSDCESVEGERMESGSGRKAGRDLELCPSRRARPRSPTEVGGRNVLPCAYLSW
jgi:hypothetical protein